jgi:nitroimidazol reductase NimA-like FMN-containing flavoprotein (pyridoxamine 5'-phosphate oxidase superfamily)
MSWLRGDEVPDVDVLTADESWALVDAAPIGRLAVRAGDGIDIFPVNFTVRERTLYFRSAPGSKLVDITHASAVAFEIDGEHRRTHWSVVVQGTAERMSFDTDIEASGVLDLETMTSSAKWNYVRIVPTSVSGRRFKARR